MSSEVAVYPGQIVIVDPGTEFEFAPGIGFTVQEKGNYLSGFRAFLGWEFADGICSSWFCLLLFD